MAVLSALQHMGFAYETTYGTAVAPTFWVPVNSAKPEDEVKKINDEGRRANLTKLFNVYDGVTSSKMDLSMDCYADAVGYFLKAIMGQDSVTGTSPNYTHTFKVVNALAPSMTLAYYNGITEHRHAGSVLTDLGFKFDTEGILTMDAKYLGMKSTTIAPVTASYSTVAPFLGYQSALTLAGSGNTNLVGGEINIKRDCKLLYGANNTQAPTKFSSGRIDITGKLTFDVETETELALLGAADPSILLTFTQNANLSLAFQFSLADIRKANIDTSQEFVRVDLEFDAYYNATDAGNATITLKNQVAAY